MNLTYDVIEGDCRDVLSSRPTDWFDCVFADPPDNVGLDYGSYSDSMPADEYSTFLKDSVSLFISRSPVVWVSFRATHQHYRAMCSVDVPPEWNVKPCVQTFTFGNYQSRDLTNCHRPLLRFTSPAARLYPDEIRVTSDRQKAGDKRADPRGKVPGDVFDFCRVTGNNYQRRSWHPTQLHEGLVSRAILLTTKPGDHILDPFGGTGTVLRVCKRLGRSCTTIELNPQYAELIRKENL